MDRERGNSWNGYYPDLSCLHLADSFLDIHLNATTRWKDVPKPVWHYTLGGYQVLKKWLSYRESALLGRPLTTDEAQQFTHHVRRIGSILALHGELEEHYGASL